MNTALNFGSFFQGKEQKKRYAGQFRLRVFFILFLFLLLFSCQEKKEKPDISFYHWQSYFDMTNKELNYLDSLNVDELYIRYYDIDLVNGRIQPIGKIIQKNDSPINKEIIPTIFITNKVMKEINKNSIEDICNKTINLIYDLHKKIGTKEIKSVQFDCDWTKSSKENYFSFLEKIKEISGWNISTTIRLHQIKYKNKTGIPPADEYVLMAYNTGNISDQNEKNSILNPEVVAQYISKKTYYPKKMNIALPLFQWGVLFRDNKIIKIINDVNESTFSDASKFEVIENKIQVKKNTYLKGYSLYTGDEIRLERVSLSNLEKTIDILDNAFHPEKVLFYHLDSNIIKTYPHEKLENLIQPFNH